MGADFKSATADDMLSCRSCGRSDAYLTLPDLIAAVEAGEKAINVGLSTTRKPIRM